MSLQVLNELLQPLVEDLGYEFIGLEYNPNPKHSVLRIYIDHENGVGIQQRSSFPAYCFTVLNTHAIFMVDINAQH